MKILKEPFVWPELPPLEDCPEPLTAALIILSARGIVLARGGLIRSAIAEAAADLRASEIGDVLNGAIECILFKQINTNHFDIDVAEVFYLMNLAHIKPCDWSRNTPILVRACYLQSIYDLINTAAGTTPATSAHILTSTSIPHR